MITDQKISECNNAENFESIDSINELRESNFKMSVFMVANRRKKKSDHKSKGNN